MLSELSENTPPPFPTIKMVSSPKNENKINYKLPWKTHSICRMVTNVFWSSAIFTHVGAEFVTVEIDCVFIDNSFIVDKITGILIYDILRQHSGLIFIGCEVQEELIPHPRNCENLKTHIMHNHLFIFYRESNPCLLVSYETLICQV